MYSYGFDFLLLFQNGLTAVHIACKSGRRTILSSLLEKAKTQKHFCFKRSLPSDYDVVMSAKAREVGVAHNCKLLFMMHGKHAIVFDNGTLIKVRVAQLIPLQHVLLQRSPGLTC